MSDSTARHSEEDSFEGPDVEVPTTGPEGEPKPGGLGEDGTIPDEPDGVAAGHTGVPSTFEPEEDELADEGPL